MKFNWFLDSGLITHRHYACSQTLWKHVLNCQLSVLVSLSLVLFHLLCIRKLTLSTGDIKSPNTKFEHFRKEHLFGCLIVGFLHFHCHYILYAISKGLEEIDSVKICTVISVHFHLLLSISWLDEIDSVSVNPLVSIEISCVWTNVGHHPVEHHCHPKNRH